MPVAERVPLSVPALEQTAPSCGVEQAIRGEEITTQKTADRLDLDPGSGCSKRVDLNEVIAGLLVPTVSRLAFPIARAAARYSSMLVTYQVMRVRCAGVAPAAAKPATRFRRVTGVCAPTSSLSNASRDRAPIGPAMKSMRHHWMLDRFGRLASGVLSNPFGTPDHR